MIVCTQLGSSTSLEEGRLACVRLAYCCALFMEWLMAKISSANRVLQDRD